MRLGFLILSYNEPDDLFIKLLEFLNTFENAVICVHHDYYQSNLSPELIEKYKLLIVKKYFKTYWSHVNNVLATIEGFKQLLESISSPDWIITLTPNCFPVKSKDDIASFFDVAKDDAFIDMHKVSDYKLGNVDEWLLRDMQKQPWFKLPFFNRKGRLVFRQIRKKIPYAKNYFLNGAYKYYQGSNYFFLNKKVVTQIINPDSEINRLIQFYKNYIKATPEMHPCPQETIIQTFVANLSGINICFKNYRYIDWVNRINWSPNWLTEKHFDEIKKGDSLWARKLRYPESAMLIKKIEKELL